MASWCFLGLLGPTLAQKDVWKSFRFRSRSGEGVDGELDGRIGKDGFASDGTH